MRPIGSVAIIGAGNMGSGIAQKSAQEQFDIQMVDREEQWVERGQSIIAGFLDEAIDCRKHSIPVLWIVPTFPIIFSPCCDQSL